MALKLMAEIGLDGRAFESGLSKLKSQIAAVFGAAAIGAMIKKSVDRMDELADSAERLGVSVEYLQELGFAARQSSKDIKDLTAFIEKLNDARAGNAASWAKLGVTPEMRANAPIQDIMSTISQNIKGRNPAEYIGALRDVGGRAAGGLVPLLVNLEELRAKANAVGAVTKSSVIAAVKVAKDQLQSLSDVLLTKLAPAIAAVMATIAYSMNDLASAKSFWSKFTEEPGLWEEFIDSNRRMVGLEPKFGTEPGALKRRFLSAGAAADTTKEETDAAVTKAIIALTAALGKPPNFGGVDLDEPAPARVPKATFRDAADPLIQVGNFLGSGRNAAEFVARESLNTLRQIEQNTRPRPETARDDIEFP